MPPLCNLQVSNIYTNNQVDRGTTSGNQILFCIASKNCCHHDLQKRFETTLLIKK